MALRAPVIGTLAALAGVAILGLGLPAGGAETFNRSVVIRDEGGAVLARVALSSPGFAVSYRNSIYGTLAEERYRVLDDNRYRLVEIAADQMAVIEEYYALPGPPRPALSGDRRVFTAAPDPARPLVLDRLSIAATDLGERTLHVPGEPPLALWRLVEDEQPFVLLNIEGTS